MVPRSSRLVGGVVIVAGGRGGAGSVVLVSLVWRSYIR